MNRIALILLLLVAPAAPAAEIKWVVESVPAGLTREAFEAANVAAIKAWTDVAPVLQRLMQRR